MNKIILLLLVCFICVFGFVLYSEMNGEFEKEISKKEEIDKVDDTIVTERASEVDIAKKYIEEIKQSGNIENSSLFNSLLKEKVTSDVPNNELQRYILGQTSINGNHIRIRADKTVDGYVSGRLDSNIGVLYGIYTFKIKNMIGNGLFPAIWLLPTGLGGYPEVDIYEHIGNEPGTIYGVLHYLKGEEKLRNFFHYDFSDSIPSEYTIKLVWDENHMAWYINNQLVHTVTDSVPKVPMYFIINLAIGGIWPKDPTPDVEFPAYFDVEVLEFSPEEIVSR